MSLMLNFRSFQTMLFLHFRAVEFENTANSQRYTLRHCCRPSYPRARGRSELSAGAWAVRDTKKGVVMSRHVQCFRGVRPLTVGVALALTTAVSAQNIIDMGGQWGRVGAGLDSEGRARAELLLRAAPGANQRAIVEAYGGDGQALGLKLSYHVAPQRGPLPGVLKTFVAFDRSATKDRKLTAGFGGEVNDMFWALYASKGVSDGRASGFLGGAVIEQRPYDWGFGLRLGTFFDSALLRLTLGADYDQGKQGAKQSTSSLLAEKYFLGSPVSVALNVEALSRRSELAPRTEETRGGMTVRIDLGGARNAVTQGPSIGRSLDNPITHKSSVDVYSRRSTSGPAIGNVVPTPADDTLAAVSNGSEIVIDVLANDKDPNGDTLTLASVGAAQRGTTRIVGGRVGYTATAGFAGNDAFTYTVSDGKGATAVGTVRVTVTATTTPAPTPTPAPANRPPVANADAFTVTAGSTGNVLSVLANDTDPDRDTLALSALTAPTNGTAAIVGATVVYAPRTGFSGVDTFSYTVIDGKGSNATGAVTVTVSPTAAPTPAPTPTAAPGSNRPPVAVADVIKVNCNGSTSFNVLTNDSDPDAGDTISVTGFSPPPANTGSLDFKGAGTFTFSGNGTNFGSASFQYQLSDGKGATVAATVTLNC